MSEEKNIPEENSKQKNLNEQELVARQPETSNQQPENMEVHKHPHHVTDKKKWSEYFLEFFMLFLAVFLGFLAENWREESVEHRREKEYMQSLVNDLKRDTAFLHTGFPRKEDRIKAIDSVFLFFDTHPKSNQVPGYVAANMRRTSWDRQYERNTGTIDQLKNAGGLRLIRDKQVADSIAAYDLLWARADFWKDGYIYNQRQCQSFIEKIFNPYDFLSIYRKADRSSTQQQRELVSIKINTESVDEYLNYLWRQKGWTRQDCDFYKSVQESAERLITMIKKEYHLE